MPAAPGRSLLILGASGGCGRWATRIAAERGHRVTALVRAGTPYEPPDGVRVVRGSALDVATVTDAARGCDVVISCLGPRRSHPANPWSALASPDRFAEESARVVVCAMRTAGVPRVVAISAAGVGDSDHLLPGLMRWVLRSSTVGVMYADLACMESVYRDSGLDWLAVRPVTLVNGAPSSRAKVVPRFRMISTIGRADVARWLVDAAEAPGLGGSRTPMIGWR